MLHLFHADESVEVAQNIVERALLGHIALNVFFLNLNGLRPTADERREDVLSRLHGHMGIAEGLVLYLDLVLEEAGQLMLRIWGESRNAVFRTKLHTGNIAQLMIIGSGQPERVLEAVLHSRVALQEIVKSLGKACHDDNGIVVPLVHLDKELVKRVHLVGILIGQQFLHVVEKEEAATSLLDVLVPLVHETLVVDGINHGQLRLL